MFFGDPDTRVYDSPRVKVGAFRCPVGHPLFADSGAIRNHIVVFPRTSVWIQHEGGRPFVGHPGIATIYNAGQVYSRRAISPDGDRCDWFGVDLDTAAGIARELDPGAARAERPFRSDHAPVPRSLYLQQRVFFERLRAGEPVEAFEVEERVVSLIGAVLESGRAQEGARAKVPPASRRADPDRAAAAEAVLGRRFREALTLSDVAAEVEASTFHLARLFRRATGDTLHARLVELRLRTALEELADRGTGLTQIALGLGFSSHAHFSAAFRSRFGVPPSAARARLRVSRRRPSAYR